MESYRLQRIGGIAGIAALVLGLASFFIPAYPPAADAPAAKVVSFYASHRSGLLLQSYLAGLSDALLLLFTLSIAVYFGKHGASRVVVASIAVASALAGVLDLAGAAVLGALAFASNTQLDPSLVRTLYDAGLMLRSSTVYFPTALFAAAAATAILQTDVLPRWMSWLGWATAIGSLLVPALTLGSPVSIAVFLVFIVWMVIVAVRMIQEPATATANVDYSVRPAGA